MAQMGNKMKILPNEQDYRPDNNYISVILLCPRLGNFQTCDQFLSASLKDVQDTQKPSKATTLTKSMDCITVFAASQAGFSN